MQNPPCIRNHVAINNIKTAFGMLLCFSIGECFSTFQCRISILSFNGKKSIFPLVQSIYVVAHSYLILPLISMPGKLRKYLFIVLQEQDDRFGTQVPEIVEENKPGNIIVQCNKSGKFTKDMFKYWIDPLKNT